MVTLTEIPSNCYVDSVETPNSQYYEVYFHGEKVKDCYGVIRYAPSLYGTGPYNWRARYKR